MAPSHPHNALTGVPPAAGFSVVGVERLPAPFAAALADSGVPITALRGGDAPVAGTSILVVVTERAGLGELATHAQGGWPHGVAALYAGTSPSIAARCAQTGASRVICLDETAPAELAAQLVLPAPGPQWPLATLDALPLAIALRDDDGTYHYRNAAHHALQPERLDGNGGTIAPLDLHQVTDPESGHVFLWSRMPIETATGGSVLETLEDITGRHTDQTEILRQRDMLVRRAWDLAHANKELANLDRAKADFIALAAHEIRTPLASLNNAVHLLKRRNPDPARQARFAEMAIRNVARLAALADDLLEYTKLETRQMSLHVAPADVGGCLWQAVDGVRTEADALGVTLDCAIGTPLPILQGEAERLGQATRRMLEHAVRRSRQGGTVTLHAACMRGWLEPTVTLPPGARPDLPETPEAWVELAVTDQGGMLPEQHVSQLFNGFASARSALADPVQGGGLGLAICRRIVGAHGGVVWAEPVAPNGTRLVMRLPCLSTHGIGLYQLAHRYQRLVRQQQTPWLASVGLCAAPGDPALLAELCQAANWPEADWVALDTPQEVVMLATGGEGQVRDRLAKLLILLPCRDDARPPIQVGWASPGDGERFRDALARARASTRPIGDGATLTIKTGDEG
ncbi:MAG: HAMP domain-containing histidine kinase [Nitrospirae bacterium]|nr:HAMP domain-containing histidine kinase [Nitrospirota bacterium]